MQTTLAFKLQITEFQVIDGLPSLIGWASVQGLSHHCHFRTMRLQWEHEMVPLMYLDASKYGMIYHLKYFSLLSTSWTDS